jgi:transposase-like protein
MLCPYCGSENTRPDGSTPSGKPQWRCRSKDCKRRWSLSGLKGRPKAKAPACPRCGSENTRHGSTTEAGSPRVHCADCGGHLVVQKESD